jgi:hypothetical protein
MALARRQTPLYSTRNFESKIKTGPDSFRGPKIRSFHQTSGPRPDYLQYLMPQSARMCDRDCGGLLTSYKNHPNHARTLFQHLKTSLLLCNLPVTSFPVTYRSISDTPYDSLFSSI